MKKKYCFILILLIWAFQLPVSAYAQDSSGIKISLLTCSPGAELYSTFGHSALRVTDSNQGTDIVYNYGTFNFGEDGFYLKFMRGKLLYYVNPENYSDFVMGYMAENRSITEQVLKLSVAAKKRVQAFVSNNSQEANKYYKYDFFLDNCTTRLRDIMEKEDSTAIFTKPIMPAGTRFRFAIHSYLDKNQKDWSKLGIDILLGLPCDARMTPQQMQFLPDNLMNCLDSNGHSLLASKQSIFTAAENPKETNVFSPLFFFSLLLIVVVAISLFQNKWAMAFTIGIDGVLFFLTGLLGLLLILMWVGTDHSMCKNNLNLLWALPTQLMGAFLLGSNKKWVKLLFRWTALLLIAVLASWYFLPQQLNTALIPFVALLAYRNYSRSTSKSS
ncbi:MAG: DUF4105 domain-containing protein [Chitinophagaceae bacterium]